MSCPLPSQAKRDLITGLKTRTNAGRPNWDKVFKQISEQRKGKVTVFFCGSPQLGKILARRHGFKCTVLFAIDPKDGTINPNVADNIPGLEALQTADLLIIVRGPIRREYQAREIEREKPHTATLDEGYRFHLHRKVDPAPLEVDPASFAFTKHAPLPGSSLIELKAWLQTLGETVPVDDAFRLLPPALGEAVEEAGSLAALRGMRSSGLTPGRDAALVLDNVAQFRFYSGWRAAIERMRSR